MVSLLLIVAGYQRLRWAHGMSIELADYAALDSKTLPARLARVSSVIDRLGRHSSSWRVREVGDGNLNLVFIVESEAGAVVVKQALPYVRLVGESWPLPLSRSYFEFHALTRQAERAPGTVPEVYYFNEGQALIVMEYLSSHQILRHSLKQGLVHEGLGRFLGRFCADTLFKGSDFSMEAAERKHDVALFAGNTALCDITESLVFTDPYFEAPLNRHTSPQLDAIVARLRNDTEAKIAAQSMKQAFCSRAESMLHGDLHTGSIMVKGVQARVIDPEFAMYGPMGFDVGMLIANFMMAWCAQPAYADADDDRQAYRDWILDVIDEIWTSFSDRFGELWRSERHGILFPATLFEDQGHHDAMEAALRRELRRVWTDVLGFCGCEIIRRILGLAHIAEYDDIEDADTRAALEAAGLTIARTLMVGRDSIESMAAVRALVQQA